MKKLLFVLALILSFSLVACGEDKPGNSTADTSDTEMVSPTGTEISSETSDLAESDGNEVTFTLYNTTSYDYTSVSISKSGENQWSDNLISGILEARSNISINIKLPEDTENRQFDVMAKDSNGDSYIFQYLDLSEATDEGGNISIDMTEGGSGFANFSRPYVEPTLTIDSAPTKLEYKVGDEFDPSGFSATYTDDAGEIITLDPDDVKFVVSKTVEITAGRPFTTAGKKVVVVQYAGLTQQFELTVE